MNTSENNTSKPQATAVRIEAARFYVSLADGREIGVPYTWFWRLEEATETQRNSWRFIGDGEGIHWEDIDEDISVQGILKGKPENPARRPRRLQPV